MMDFDSDDFEFLVFRGNLDPDTVAEVTEWPEEERSFIYDVMTMDGRTISIAAKGVKGEDYLALEKRVRARASVETFEGLTHGRWRVLLTEPH